MTNSAIRSIIIYINQISICRCSLMVKFELPKLASRVQFPSPAPCKKQTVHPSVFLHITKWELNTRRKLYNRRGGKSGCILSQANTRKTAVKVRSPQRGAEGGLDSGIFPSPAPYKNRRFIRLFFDILFIEINSCSVRFQIVNDRE